MTTLFPLPEVSKVNIMKSVIRALWWNQPFATLMLHGKIETRKRATNVRGKVLICSCKRPFSFLQLVKLCGLDIIQSIFTLLNLNIDWPEENILPLGRAIAIADLVDCRPMVKEDEARCFVAYNANLWCWVFANVQAIEPFEIKGKQGWAILDEETKSKIKIKHTK